MDVSVNFQALFTAYLVLLIMFGVMAFASLLILVFTIPTILHPYFYTDGVMLLLTGLVQITIGTCLLLIDRNRCCKCAQEKIVKSLKALLFPVSMGVFMVMWIALLAIPHNNMSHLRYGLENEVRHNSSNQLMEMGHSAFDCCGIDDEPKCSVNYLPIYNEANTQITGYQCPVGSIKCQTGCLLTIWQSMILPYRPIEMALGLFGLLLLAICPLTYAISRCRHYWCPQIVRQESSEELPARIGDMDEMPLYPRQPRFNPVLGSLLPTPIQPEENDSEQHIT